MVNRYCRVLTVLFLVLGFWGTAHPADAERPLQVTVSIAPQRYFVEQIGGERVQTTVMVPPGADLHTYAPKPQQMVALTASRIYFAVGVPFENAWLSRFRSANDGLRTVHTEAGIEKLPMAGDSPIEMNPQTGLYALRPPQSASGAGVKDPHVWLSPPLVMLQARNILTALVQIDPSHRNFYEDRYRNFVAELADLDVQIAALFWGTKPAARKPFITFHPAWGYFAAAYGLQQIPVELAGKEPTARELQKLIGFARAQGIKTVFVEPEFSIRSARTIAQNIGGRTAGASPLAKDWKENLLAVAREMEGATR